MRTRLRGPAFLCASALFAVSGVGQSQNGPERESSPLRRIQEIPLPGVEGRLDHFTIDGKRKRVIFSALGNDTVEIVDAFAGRRIHSIKGLSEPQGVLYIPDSDKLFVANAGDGKVKVFNGTTFDLTDTIDFGEDPDNLRYDATVKRVYVGYGEGAIGVIDATTNKRLNLDYKLEEHPEGFQLETRGPRIFVNVASRKHLAVIDRSTGVVTKWELGGAGANFPLTLDETNHRVFIGTRRPARLVVFDMASGRVVASLPTAGDMDDLFYDPARSRLYIPGGEGFITVFQQKDPDHYMLLDNIATSIGTRTGVYYVGRDRVYLAAPPHANIGAALLVFEAQD